VVLLKSERDLEISDEELRLVMMHRDLKSHGFCRLLIEYDEGRVVKVEPTKKQKSL
jgi:hypothetical protein